MATTTRKRIPTPTELKKMCLGGNRTYWSGFYHGLQIVPVCEKCRLINLRPPVSVTAPNPPKLGQLKWFPKSQQDYWKGYHHGRKSGLCFECIREPPMPKPPGALHLRKMCQLDLSEAIEKNREWEFAWYASQPERHPYIGREEFEKIHADLPIHLQLAAWERFLSTCPYY